MTLCIFAHEDYINPFMLQLNARCNVQLVRIWMVP